jgi:predicted outer membrane protein
MSCAATASMFKHIVFSMVFLAGNALAACSDNDDDNNNDNGNNNNRDLQARAIDQGNTRGQALQAQASQEFPGSSESDAVARAAGVVTTINNGEIAQANLVLSKTTNPDVRDLAQQMVTDHQANNAALQTLMQSRTLPPAETSVSRTLTSEAAMGLAQLQADAPDQLDVDYAQMQVMMHQEAFLIVGTVRDAMPAPASDIRGFLSDTLTVIDKHRTHAENVLSNLD